MGDGLSERAREDRIQMALWRYYTAIHVYLLDRTGPNRDAVRISAKNSDHADRNWDKKRSRESACDTLLDDLINGDECAWMKILEATLQEAPLFDKLRKLSPFRDKLLLFGNVEAFYGNPPSVKLNTRMLEEFIQMVAKTQGVERNRFCVIMPFPAPGTTQIKKIGD